jgi:hypothetical protein
MTPTETRKIARPRPAVPNAPRSDHRGEIEVCRAGFFALMMARRLRYELAREHLVASPQIGGGAAACGQHGSRTMTAQLLALDRRTTAGHHPLGTPPPIE